MDVLWIHGSSSPLLLHVLPSLAVTLALFLPSSFVATSLPSLIPRPPFLLPTVILVISFTSPTLTDAPLPSQDARRRVPRVRAPRQRRHRRHALPNSAPRSPTTTAHGHCSSHSSSSGHSHDCLLRNMQKSFTSIRRTKQM